MQTRGMSDKTFGIINTFLVTLITLIVLYPLIFVISASISDPGAVTTGNMWLWPVDITFEGFSRVFENSEIWRGYGNTIFYTLLGTFIHLFVLLPAAYALSRKEVKGKKFIIWYILLTMLFSGGMIPNYLVVQNLGMLDTVWAMVIPKLVGAWSVLVAKAFFEQTIPDSLVEASKIDGASDFRIFWKIVLPLSLPIVAVMALFHAVSLWNQYFHALIYLSDRKMYPLQLILREILIVDEMALEDNFGGGTTESLTEQIKTAELTKYSTIIVSTLPLLIAYPFLQRFFMKGVLIGSVKE